MDFLIFLTGFVIMISEGTSRPLDSNEVDSAVNVLEFKLPTTLKSGFTITMDGTLKKSDGMLTVVLPSNDVNQPSCKIKWDFEDYSVKVSPVMFQEYGEASFAIDMNGDIPFSLQLKTSDVEGKQIQFDIYASRENTGSTNALFCNADLTNIQAIRIEKGVTDISILSFNFTGAYT